MTSRKALGGLFMALAAAVAVAIGYQLFTSFFERYEQTVDNGWTEEAHRNPWLAAQMYLQKKGVTVHSYQDTTELDKALDESARGKTLFISDVELVITEERVNRLLAWVKKGGSLVVGLSGAEANRDHPLLKFFGLSVNPVEDVDELFEIIPDPSADNKPEGSGSKERYLTQLRFEGYENPVKVHLSYKSTLSHPWLFSDEDDDFSGYKPFYWGGLNDTIRFMQFELGRGQVSFINDPALWKSDKISEHDHAYLWEILTSNDQVTILYGSTVPSLFTYIWNKAPEAVSAFLAFLIAWLVYRGRRFGAVTDPVFTERRSIAEHIQAGSNYLWRTGHAGILIKELQQEIVHRCRQLCPHWAEYSQQQQYKWLAEHTGLAGELIATAMADQPKTTEFEFVRRVQALQQLRETL